MSVIHIHKHLDSLTLHLPELKALVGKNVEIVVREETEAAHNNKSSAATLATPESPEQAELRRLRLLLEEQAAYNRAFRDEEIRELLED
jgi:hypothetical protein